MRLAALYIHEHFLFDQPQTLNFGGKYSYDFVISEDSILNVEMEANETFVEGFSGRNISLASAIVGANGAGKTSILRIINTAFQEHTKAVFIYENEDGSISVDNRMGEKSGAKKSVGDKGYSVSFPEGLNIIAFDPQTLTKLYYSPVFDRLTESFASPLSLNSSDPERKVGEVFMDNVRKDAIFLHSEVSKAIKEIYADFPSYDTLYVVPKVLHKRDFRKVYIDTNLGNPQKTETLMYSIERDLRNKRFGDTESLLHEYLNILQSSNITDALNEVWEMPQYQNQSENTSHLLHDSGDFFRNIEINIISFLIINDTFAITESSGSFDFEKILKSTTFDEILDYFLAKYIVQFDRHFYERYKDKIALDQADELIQIVMSHYTMYAKTYGNLERDTMLQRNIHHNINGLKNIKRLYQIFTRLSQSIVYEKKESILKIDVHRDDIEPLLAELFGTYSKVREYFSHLPMAVRDIIDIDCNVNLSYGEKSILSLYSTFHEFTRTNTELVEADNFLLILDEADLGYHPIWKRKFMQALSLTMPELFSELDSVRRYRTKDQGAPRKKQPNLQIIIATHDPLTLSDFPNSNVVYLWKNDQGTTDVLPAKFQSMKSFGANITDLLAHSFFVEDGLIGDFAKNKIEETIAWLNEEKIKKDSLGAAYAANQSEYNHHENIIKIIDEPVIRLKLAQMLDALYDQKKVQRELIQREMDLLKEKFDSL